MNVKRAISVLLILALLAAMLPGALAAVPSAAADTDEITAVNAVDPYEPNNSHATATPIGWNEYLQATIDPTTDVDFYRVDVLAGQVIRPNLYVDGLSPLRLMLAVLDNSGAVLATDDMCGGGNAVDFEVMLPATADFYLRVQPCAGTSDPTTLYDLIVEQREQIEIEPNDTRATAQDFTGLVYGAIDPANDSDFFKFTGMRNQAVNFHAQNDDFPTTFKPSLAVFDSAGTLLGEFNSSDEYAELKVILPADAAYYLRVQTTGGSGTYYVHRSAGGIDDIEPNNTPAEAELIGYNTRSGGSFSSTDDVDYFKFNGWVGDRIQFGDVEGCGYDGLVKSLVTLLDADQNVIAQARWLESKIVTLPTTGVYYLKVEYADDEPWGGDYTLILIIPDANEPDEGQALARPIAYGDEVSDRLYPGHDADWFRFQGRAGEVVQIIVDGGFGGVEGPWLGLYDKNMKLLASDGDYDGYFAEINYLLPADGAYYLVIDDYNYCYPYGTGGGSYELSLKQTHSLYVSATADKLGGNAAIKRGDIATRDPATGQWVLVFDASDVGITQNINAFEWTSADRLLITLQKAQKVANLGTVKPHDILRFTPTQLGANTQGTFSFYLKGADVGLTKAGEKIDAIAWEEPYPAAGSRLLISTTGSGNVPKTDGGNVAFANEDLIAFDQTSTGQPVQGTWQLYLDGSILSGMAAENLGSLTMVPQVGYFDYDWPAALVALPGTWKVDGVKGGPKDVLRLDHSYWYLWSAAQQAPLLTNKPIDALSIGPVWQP